MIARTSNGHQTEATTTVLLTSFLVNALRYGGATVFNRRARAFLAHMGRHREFFLPFVYRWRDPRPAAQATALRSLHSLVERDNLAPPRVFHAPFAGRFGARARDWYRNLTDADSIDEHREALRRECRWLGLVRRDFGLPGRILYVLHLGRRHGRSVAEASAVARAVLEPAVECAHDAGVVLALENVAAHANGREHLGARLSEIGDLLSKLGDRPGGPLGWTFDLAHAMLAYPDNPSALQADAQSLLPALIHIHINAPRWPPEGLAWADRHEAPHADVPLLWDLFRTALQGPQYQEFRTVTYEVNWRVPFLARVFGGSSVGAIIRGYQLIQEAVAEAENRLVTPGTDVESRLEDRRLSPLPAMVPLAQRTPVAAPSASGREVIEEQGARL